MTDAATDIPPGAGKKGGAIKAALAGLAMAAVLGSGSFFAAYNGMISLPGKGRAAQAAPSGIAPVFVPVTEMIVTLAAGGNARHLRFVSSLEVEPGAAPDVVALMPRIVDVLNDYLRAIDPSDLNDPAILLRIRAQMLRRIMLVTGNGKVKDLLIGEFNLR